MPLPCTVLLIRLSAILSRDPRKLENYSDHFYQFSLLVIWAVSQICVARLKPGWPFLCSEFTNMRRKFAYCRCAVCWMHLQMSTDWAPLTAAAQKYHAVEWKMQCSNCRSQSTTVPVLFDPCCRPLIWKGFLLSAFFFPTLVGNQGSQNVKDCPGKQVRTSYTYYQVQFAFRHCWGAQCFCSRFRY